MLKSPFLLAFIACLVLSCNPEAGGQDNNSIPDRILFETDQRRAPSVTDIAVDNVTSGKLAMGLYKQVDSSAFQITLDYSGQQIYLDPTPILTMYQLVTAAISKDPTTGGPILELQCTPEATERLGTLTYNLVGSHVAFMGRDSLHNTAFLREPIRTGRIALSGDFEKADFQDLLKEILLLTAPYQIPE